MSDSSGKIHRITPIIMLVMMGVALFIIALQLALMLHFSLTDIKHWFIQFSSDVYTLAEERQARKIYPIFTAFFLFLTLAGWGYELRANALARRGLRYSHGVIVWFLNILTHRRPLEAQLIRQQHETSLTQDDLTRAFLSLLPSQASLCRDLATFLRLRLNRNRPAAGTSSSSLLFISPTNTGKYRLAQIIAQKLQRPFLALNFTPFSSESARQSWNKILEDTRQNKPDAVIEILYRLSPSNQNHALLRTETEQYVEALLPLWRPNHGRDQNNLVILTLSLPEDAFQSASKERSSSEEFLTHHTFLSPLLPFCEKIFICPPLTPLDVASIAARGLEDTIKAHGLTYETEAIDPYLLLKWQEKREGQTQHSLQPLLHPEELQHAIEEQISEALIAAMQHNKPYIRLILEENRFVIMATALHDQRLTPLSKA